MSFPFLIFIVSLTELHDLSSDDETFDNISSSNVCDSPGQCSLDAIKYNTLNIKAFLKEYVLVENHKVNHVKPSPAVKDENDRSIVIKNFATCRS